MIAILIHIAFFIMPLGKVYVIEEYIISKTETLTLERSGRDLKYELIIPILYVGSLLYYNLKVGKKWPDGKVTQTSACKARTIPVWIEYDTFEL